MINLTKEAIRLAEETMISQMPQLANKEFRQKLSVGDKMMIFQNLVVLGEFYEQDLIWRVGK